MGGVFSWIRERVRAAVLAGFADAARELQECAEPEALLLEHRPEAPAPEPENGRARARK